HPPSALSFPTRRSSDLAYLRLLVRDLNDGKDLQRHMDYIVSMGRRLGEPFLTQAKELCLDVEMYQKNPQDPVCKEQMNKHILKIDRKSTRLNSSHVKI